jgi:precorrin-3B C17-methyltransferase
MSSAAPVMSGSVTVVGLGPGSEAMVTPEVSAALASATDILGYTPYVARIPERDGLTLHPSDNREELARAGHALDLAAAGRHAVVVSSGDPGSSPWPRPCSRLWKRRPITMD